MTIVLQCPQCGSALESSVISTYYYCKKSYCKPAFRVTSLCTITKDRMKQYREEIKASKWR